MDPDVAALLAQIKAGPISKLTKPHLLIVAKALGIEVRTQGPDKIGVPDIKILINEALKAPEYAQREEFQKFVIYPRGSGSAATVKNSVDKAAADALLSKLPEGPPTGAHDKLLKGNGKSDPAPQFKRIGNGNAESSAPKKKEQQDDQESKSSEDSSPLSSDAEKEVGNSEDEISKAGKLVIGKQKAEAATNTDEMNLIVHFKGPDAQPKEVWLVPSQRSQVQVVKAADNSYYTSLKTLLPLALDQESPIKKDRRAKLAITGPLGGHLPLGTVGDFENGGVPERLQLGAIDQYKLKETPAGLLCDIFFEPKESLEDTKVEAAGVTGNLTGPESKPLEVAQERRTANDAKADAEDTPLVRFLRAKLEGPARKRPTLTKIGLMKARFLELKAATEKAKEAWGEGANFRVSNDSPEFAGAHFKTQDILLAMRIMHTTAHNDKKLFKYARVSDDHTGKADAYVSDDKHCARFDNMTVNEWNTYLDNKKQEKEAEERDEARKQEKKRKRQQEKEEKKERKGKSSKKQKRTEEDGITSDTLDNHA
ncbi:hypothetical protein DFH06DRAFT_1375769 [Mycena polygramma]|nr:hypothetical protein DFH06DRAFT_1375769 [Mycena polygramma]